MSDAGIKTPPPLPGSARDAWHYSFSGKASGPVSTEKLQALYDNGALSDDTLVWNERVGGEWVKLSAARIINHLGSPPLPANEISDRYVWMIAALPILGAIIEIIATGDVIMSLGAVLLYAIANGILAVRDSHLIQKSGRNPVAPLWGFIVVPAYLVMRSRNLKKSYVPLICWIAAITIVATIPSERVIAELGAFSTTLPRCEHRSSIAQVKAIFPNIPMNVAKLPALEVRNIRTVTSSSEMNTCEAVIETVGGTTFPARYTIQERDGKYWYYVNLVFD